MSGPCGRSGDGAEPPGAGRTPADDPAPPDTAGRGAAGGPGGVPPTMSLPIVVGEPTEVQTIGIALEIPEPWSGYLRQCRHSFGDPMAQAIPPHITLLPPTALARFRLAEIEEHLQAVAATLRPFELHLAGTDTFRPVSPVVFVNVAAGAAECDTLQSRIRTGPLDRDLNFPYHPHVTVGHHLSHEALDTAEEVLRDFSAAFVLDGFDLYELCDDGIWRSLHRYVLGNGTPQDPPDGGAP
jgi:2'-5' RNA ligase